VPESTRVLVIGDPHFRISNIQDAREFTGKIGLLIQKTRPNIVIILGDLHNDFERIHSLVMAEIVALFRAILQALAEDDGHLYYIVGNHDAINNQIFLTEEHAFLPFKEWPHRICIVDKPTYTNGFLMVPYVPPGRFNEALNTYPQMVEPRAIFCHQEFRGVQLGPIKSRHGDEWPEDAPLIVSGHIHEHQWLQKNILYVGAPFDQSFGEDSQKSVTLFDFTKEGYTLQHVDLGMPKRITIKVTIDELRAYEKPQNAHVRAYVSGTTEELSAFKKTKEYKMISQKLKIIPKPTDPIVVRRNENGRGYHDILRDLVSEESEHVQDALREVVNAGTA
jgi:DNA repair exonuclease SbcCD nuclease subunit